MKKRLLAILILIFSKTYSQLYFSADMAMYVKNQVVYVGQNINLSSDTFIYLRNNSQLVQGTTGVSSNSGAGMISIFQEGTSDNFDYNYWCSPVGNASAAEGNENFGITMLYRPTSSINSTAAIMLPIGNYDGISTPLSIAPYWIYKLQNSSNYSQWIQVGSATNLAPGEGFTMKGTSGSDSIDPESTGIINNPGGTGAQRYDFRGKPNDGNINVNVGTNNSTLTGNPYPSALDLNAFLLDPTNTAGSGIAYFWEQDKTVNSHYLADYRAGYGSYSPISLVSNGIYVPATFSSYNADGSLNTIGTSSGLSIERKYSPIGQGFVIKGNLNGVVTLKNEHRIYYKEGSGLSQFEKPRRPDQKSKPSQETAEEVSHFKINIIINNQFTRQLALALIPEATDLVDYGIDALNLNETLPNDVNFLIDNRNYVIQGVDFDLNKKIPFRVKATTSATFQFYIPEVINFDPLQKIYLYDTIDGSYHNIKNEIYQVNLPAGTNTDRFKIAFTSQALSVNEERKEQFFIYQNNTSQTLKAYNPDNKTLKSFTLYDILGRIVLFKKDLQSEQNYYYSTTGLSSGIYIAEFITIENEKYIQKVFITNSEKK
ncbi:T9SS type A sorting domain-containing protein [Flavobacterium hydrocarbonoxydans]|nr:T9SS type A sorting domain-containing protein [Flavobacterium hydrocarbonoxydans]